MRYFAAGEQWTDRSMGAQHHTQLSLGHIQWHGCPLLFGFFLHYAIFIFILYIISM